MSQSADSSGRPYARYLKSIQNIRSCLSLFLLFVLVLIGGFLPPNSRADAGSAATGDAALARSRSGVAEGYADDKSCSAAGCHAELVASFGKTDKAKAFLPVREAEVIEDFTHNQYYHAASQRHYEMTRRGGRLFFRRYQTDDRGGKINVIEQEVKYVQGAGTFVRAYLYQTPAGEIFQLPIAWYSRTRSWGMPPGYDLPAHYGLQRQVHRECQFCHNAYPDLPKGADRSGMPQIFPADLPHGMGCQRCHGPGAEHVRLGLLEKRNERGVTRQQVRMSIVNPKHLKTALQNDVCYQCHARPASLMHGVVRFNRGDFSYRPGEPLSDYLVQVFVKTEGSAPPGQLGAISQPYRMEMSRCFRESGGKITCTLCHDSHRKLSPTEQAARFSAVCLGCHETRGCRRAGAPESGSGSAQTAADAGRTQDCTTCHMPKRLSNVNTMIITDHRIRSRPDLRVPEGPPRRDLPVITDAEVRDIGGIAGELYRAAAVVQSGGGKNAVDRLAKLVDRIRPAEVEPYMILAMGRIMARQWREAERTIELILLKSPQDPQALEWLGIARTGLGKTDEAIGLLRQVAGSHPERAEAWFNLGLVLSRTGHLKKAAAALEKAVAVRPPMAQAWYYLGTVYRRLDRPADAELRLRRALEIDPSHTRAYMALGSLLLSEGKRPEALRFLRLGAKVAEKKEEVSRALAAAEKAKE
jgi:predicted CXXCH cytochrome family protein